MGVVMHTDPEWVAAYRELEARDEGRARALSTTARDTVSLGVEPLSPEEIKCAELMGNSVDSLRKFKRNEKVRTMSSSSGTERDLAKAFGFNSVEDYREHYPPQTDWVEGDDRSFRAHLAKMKLEAAAQWEVDKREIKRRADEEFWQRFYEKHPELKR